MNRQQHKPRRNRGPDVLNIAFGIFFLILISLLALKMAVREPSTRYVLLSFDVEPVDGTQNVMNVLDVVYRHNVSSTFFITGSYAEAHPEMVKLMAGREIACHGYSHTAFTKMTEEEARSEMVRCREVLEKLSGREVVGFRAPYNKIDWKTLKVLEDLGFTYDASMIKGWSVLYPKLDGLRIGEIPVSSFLGIPMEDYAWLYFIDMSTPYFYVMQNKQSHIESYLFHPHHIAQHKEEFEALIKHLKDENVIFISHQELTETQHEGV